LYFFPRSNPIDYAKRLNRFLAALLTLERTGLSVYFTWPLTSELINKLNIR